jgi:hypothetical protein
MKLAAGAQAMHAEVTRWRGAGSLAKWIVV